MRVLEFNCGAVDARLQEGIAQVVAAAGHDLLSTKASAISLWLKGGQITVYNEKTPISFVFDKAFVRGRGRYAHMTSLVVRLLKHHNTALYGSLSAGELTDNDGKITQMVDLSLAQLPIPETIIFSKNTFAHVPSIVAAANLSFPAVLKRTGSKGACVWKVDSLEACTEYLNEVEDSEVFLLQEYIPNTFDIRALYFRGHFLGAMARKSADGFYNNASKGAEVEEITLTAEEHALSLEACRVLNQDFAGVDIVRSERGPLFFEVNNRPGFEGFERATGIHVGVAVANIMLEST